MYNFFIEEDDGTLVYHGKVTRHTLSNGKKNISISGILDSGYSQGSAASNQPWSSANSTSPKATPPMRYLDADKGGDPESEQGQACTCPIRDLMASGHLPGCPEKP